MGFSVKYIFFLFRRKLSINFSSCGLLSVFPFMYTESLQLLFSPTILKETSQVAINEFEVFKILNQVMMFNFDRPELLFWFPHILCS